MEGLGLTLVLSCEKNDTDKHGTKMEQNSHHMANSVTARLG